MKTSFLKSWQQKQRRITVFGGIFDPVHKGHMQAAKDALQTTSFVYFAPERQPWHKQGTTSYEHRLAMLQAASERYSKIGVLDYPEDTQAIEPFFTWVHSQFPDYAITWMIGSDAAFHIESWPGLETLEQNNVDRVLIVQRKGHQMSKPILIPGVSVYRIKTRNHHMSSSYVRDNINSRHTALPVEVQDYIKQHKLYQ